jgi:hypothetical protein
MTKITGKKVSGYKVLTKATLGSIGSMLFWYDYRYNYDIVTLSGINRVKNWRSLSKGNSITNQNANLLYIKSEGFGYYASDASTNAHGVAKPMWPELNKLHNGSPFILSFVIRARNSSGVTSNASVFVTYSTVRDKPGILVRLNFLAQSVQLTVRNATANLFSDTTTAGTFPLDEDVLVTVIFYGDTSAGNYVVKYKAFSQAFSRNVTHISSDCDQFNILIPVSIENDIMSKLFVAYDMTGKNRTQIDAFYSTFVTTLKEDSEYTSLVTS